MTNLDTQGTTAGTPKSAIQRGIATMMGIFFLVGSKRKYGIIAALAIIAVVGGFFGFNAWQKSQDTSQAAASELFEVFMEAYEIGDDEKAAEVVATLKTTYPKTPYANAVELFVASDAVQNGKLDEAKNALTWIIHEGGSFGVTLARTRLARIQLAQGEKDKALETLNAIPEAEHQPWFDEIRGDIALASSQKQEAGALYEKALQAYLTLGLDVTLVQMKLNQVTAIAPAEGNQ